MTQLSQPSELTLSPEEAGIVRQGKQTLRIFAELPLALEKIYDQESLFQATREVTRLRQRALDSAKRLRALPIPDSQSRSRLHSVLEPELQRMKTNSVLALQHAESVPNEVRIQAITLAMNFLDDGNDLEKTLVLYLTSYPRKKISLLADEEFSEPPSERGSGNASPELVKQSQIGMTEEPVPDEPEDPQPLPAQIIVRGDEEPDN